MNPTEHPLIRFLNDARGWGLQPRNNREQKFWDEVRAFVVEVERDRERRADVEQDE